MTLESKHSSLPPLPSKEHFSPHHEQLVEETDSNYPVIKLCFDNRLKVKILFMKQGACHLSEKSFPFEYAEEIGYSSRPECMADLVSELQSLGFIVDTHDDGGEIKSPDEPEDERHYFFLHFADNKDSLEKIKQSHSSSLDGILYGYPETAVKGVAEGNFYLFDQFPLEIKKNPVSELCFFLLSKDNYQEEWKWFIDTLQKINQEHPNLIHDLGLDDMFKQDLRNEIS